jgi:hypothetical protein
VFDNSTQTKKKIEEILEVNNPASSKISTEEKARDTFPYSTIEKPQTLTASNTIQRARK